MNPRSRRLLRRMIPATLVGLCATALLATVGTAAAAPAPARLSVHLNDGVTQVQPDMNLTYTAALTNLGAKPVDATLVLTVPAYVKITARNGATVKGNNATWTATVKPGKTVKHTAKAHIGTIAKSQLRVTALISVYHGKATGVPLVRSADADTIKGVTDPKPAAAASTASPTVAQHSDSGSNTIWFVIIPIIIIAVLASGALLLINARRRRISRRRGAEPSHAHDSPVDSRARVSNAGHDDPKAPGID